VLEESMVRAEEQSRFESPFPQLLLTDTIETFLKYHCTAEKREMRVGLHMGVLLRKTG
jgi:hypothetical protein